MLPQSASGGCTPSPRKLSAAMNRKVKQKRRPNSAVSGGIALGRISRLTIHHQPSPRSRAASTNSRLTRSDRDRAGQAEHLGRIEDGDRDDQHRQPGAQHRQDDEGENQRRHRQQEVDEPRQRLIDPAARDRGGEAGDDADEERQGGDDERQADRHARAIDQPAEQIAAEIVEAEPMLRARDPPRRRRARRPGRKGAISGANTATSEIDGDDRQCRSGR